MQQGETGVRYCHPKRAENKKLPPGKKRLTFKSRRDKNDTSADIEYNIFITGWLFHNKANKIPGG